MKPFLDDHRRINTHHRVKGTTFDLRKLQTPKYMTGPHAVEEG
jgi:hypothetical protein